MLIFTFLFKQTAYLEAVHHSCAFKLHVKPLPLLVLHSAYQLHVLLGRLAVVLVQEDLRLNPFQGLAQIHLLHIRVFNLLQLLTELFREYPTLVVCFNVLQGVVLYQDVCVCDFFICNYVYSTHLFRPRYSKAEAAAQHDD